MALRSSHGKGKDSALVRVEAAGLRELPRGIPADPTPEEVEDPRTTFGPLAAGSPEAKAQALRASRAAAEKRARIKALQGLGLHETPDYLEPYEAHAHEFCDVVCAMLAESIGAGTCPVWAASMVQSAALALAASRAAYAISDPALGAKLADSARTQLLTAWELTARTAGSRPKANLDPRLAAFFPELAEPTTRKRNRKARS